jgi:enoyl-CoA hydratase/carnithine racemase
VIGAADAIDWGLADVHVPSARLAALADALCGLAEAGGDSVRATVAAHAEPPAPGKFVCHQAAIDRHFAQESVAGILASLSGEQADAGTAEWARQAHAAIVKGSPLMACVTLEQVRRARTMTLAEDLRMERDLVRHCFALRPGAASETVEGVRALAIDKDHSPRWNPATVAEVTPEMVAAFFASPWPAHAHPLRELA